MIGNEVCNDETNNEDCNYDGGDCCESCVAMEECTECACIKEIVDSIGNRVCTNTQGSIKSPGYPLGYIQNIDWTWLIQVPTDKWIKLDSLTLTPSQGGFLPW